MPSTSAKQARFMRAVAHGWKPDEGDAPPVEVAREFMNEDEKRKRRFAAIHASISDKGCACGGKCSECKGH